MEPNKSDVVAKAWAFVIILGGILVFIVGIWLLISGSLTNIKVGPIEVEGSKHEATPTPTPSFTSTPVPPTPTLNLALKSNTVLYGPVNGTIRSKISDNIPYVGYKAAVKNFTSTATFYTPATSDGKWNYGFIFRHTDCNQEYRLGIKSDGDWELQLLNGSCSKADVVSIQKGTITNLKTSPQSTNEITININDIIGTLQINGHIIIDSLDLRQKQLGGEVWIASDLYNNYGTDKYEVKFQNFIIAST